MSEAMWGCHAPSLLAGFAGRLSRTRALWMVWPASWVRSSTMLVGPRELKGTETLNGMACRPRSSVSSAPHAIGQEMPALLGGPRAKTSLLGRTSPLAALKVAPPSVDTYSVQVPAWKSPSETRTLVGSEGSTAM